MSEAVSCDECPFKNVYEGHLLNTELEMYHYHLITYLLFITNWDRNMWQSACLAPVTFTPRERSTWEIKGSPSESVFMCSTQRDIQGSLFRGLQHPICGTDQHHHWSWLPHTHMQINSEEHTHTFCHEQTQEMWAMQMHTMYSHHTLTHTHTHKVRLCTTAAWQGQWIRMNLNSDDAARRLHPQWTEEEKLQIKQAEEIETSCLCLCLIYLAALVWNPACHAVSCSSFWFVSLLFLLLSP